MSKKEKPKNPEFHYSSTERLYLAKVELYFNRNQCELAPPFNRDGISKLIQIILQAKTALSKNELICSKLNRLLDTYDVVVENRSYKLIKKGQNPYVYYISCEDAFNIIAEAHLTTNHGGYERIMRHIRPIYCIDKSAVKLFLRLCDVCKFYGSYGKGTEKGAKLNDTCRVAINLINNSDQSFGYILSVVDNATDYVHLRPLTSRDEMSVAIELLKIFMDYGPPFIIETSAKKFFKAVARRIEDMCPEFYISVVSAEINLSELYCRVEKYLKIWQNKYNCKNWTFGVHMVQWWLNNTQDLSFTTHFENVFHREPNGRLATNDLSLSDKAGNEAWIATDDTISLEPINSEDINKSLLVPQIDIPVMFNEKSVETNRQISVRLDEKDEVIRNRQDNNTVMKNLEICLSQSIREIVIQSLENGGLTSNNVQIILPDTRNSQLTSDLITQVPVQPSKSTKKPSTKKRRTGNKDGHRFNNNDVKMSLPFNEAETSDTKINHLERGFEKEIHNQPSTSKETPSIKDHSVHGNYKTNDNNVRTSLPVNAAKVPETNIKLQTETVMEINNQPSTSKKSPLTKDSVHGKDESSSNSNKVRATDYDTISYLCSEIPLQNTNAGKITLLSVEIEEDSDGEEKILKNDVVCHICKKCILNGGSTCTFCKKDVHEFCISVLNVKNCDVIACNKCILKIKRKMGSVTKGK